MNTEFSISADDIKKIKDTFNLNQTVLADIIGVSQSTMARLENVAKSGPIFHDKLFILNNSLQFDDEIVFIKELLGKENGNFILNTILHIGTLIIDSNEFKESNISNKDEKKYTNILTNVFAAGAFTGASVSVPLPLPFAIIGCCVSKIFSDFKNNNKESANLDISNLNNLLREVIDSELDFIQENQNLKNKIIDKILSECTNDFYSEMDKSGNTNFKKQQWALNILAPKIKDVLESLSKRMLTVKYIIHHAKTMELFKFLQVSLEN